MRVIRVLLIELLFVGILVGQQESVLVFGNGISTNQEQAWRNHRLLELTYAGHLGVSVEELREEFEPQVAYNTTQCASPEDPDGTALCLADWFEAFVQAGEQNGSTFEIRDVWKFLFSDSSLSPDIWSVFANTATLLAQNLSPQHITQEDTARHLALYRQKIEEGKKVILVAHSQGNFFANAAYENLTLEEQQSFGIVSVATPARYVAGGWPYSTSYTDFIHTLPAALSPNTLSGPLCIPGWGCHAFRQYLEGEVSGPRIMSHIDEAVVRLSRRPLVPDTLIGVDTQRNILIQIEPVTGTIRDIGPLGYDGVTGLAFNQNTGDLIGFDQVTKDLIRINPVTGAGSRIVRVALMLPLNTISDITFGPGGFLYAVAGGESSTGQIITINMTTGEVNHVGPLRTMQLGALVYDADSQRLFTSTSGLGLFYEVDPVLGALTFLGDGFRRVSMLCDIPGSTDLYALRFDPVFNWLLFLGRADTDLPYPIEASFGFLTSLQISSIEMVVLPSGQ